MGWQVTAQSKREAVEALIPADWRLRDPPPREQERDVTGAAVRQHLSARELDITETDAVGIARRTSAGEWSALEVTRAFCHRAALAHQLVNESLSAGEEGEV